jgi:hypothetical protein
MLNFITPGGKSKAACAGVLVLVFVCGALAGAALMTFGGHAYLRRSPPFWTSAGQQISVEKWQRELSLTPQQAEEMKVILDDFATYYRNVLGTLKNRIDQLLNEQQKRKFDKMVDEVRGKQLR